MTYLHGDISKTSINMDRLRVDLFQTFRRLSEANHVIGPVVILVFNTGE